MRTSLAPAPHTVLSQLPTPPVLFPAMAAQSSQLLPSTKAATSSPPKRVWRLLSQVSFASTFQQPGGSELDIAGRSLLLEVGSDSPFGVLCWESGVGRGDCWIEEWTGGA